MMFYNRCIIRQIIKSEVTTKISKKEVTTITAKYWFGWKKMEHKNKCQEEFWSYKFTRNSNLNKKNWKIIN